MGRILTQVELPLPEGRLQVLGNGSIVDDVTIQNAAFGYALINPSALNLRTLNTTGTTGITNSTKGLVIEEESLGGRSNLYRRRAA
jgi:hypothetical protein